MTKNTRFQGHTSPRVVVNTTNNIYEKFHFSPLRLSTPPTNSWANLNTNANNSDLFSFDEMKNITFELIHKLRTCKSKLDQLKIVLSIACKFLSP